MRGATCKKGRQFSLMAGTWIMYCFIMAGRNEKMVQDLTGENPLLRAYYYHCLPYQSAEPTPEEKQKFSSAERFLRRLSRLNSFTVRKGKLQYKGKTDDGKPLFEQK